MTDENKPKDIIGTLCGMITIDTELPPAPIWESPVSRSAPPFTWDGTIAVQVW